MAKPKFEAYSRPSAQRGATPGARALSATVELSPLREAVLKDMPAALLLAEAGGPVDDTSNGIFHKIGLLCCQYSTIRSGDRHHALATNASYSKMNVNRNASPDLPC